MKNSKQEIPIKKYQYILEKENELLKCVKVLKGQLLKKVLYVIC
nr:MAG TPA: hypothetical protein [Caudoviricetes sp.]